MSQNNTQMTESYASERKERQKASNFQSLWHIMNLAEHNFLNLVCKETIHMRILINLIRISGKRKEIVGFVKVQLNRTNY